MLRRLVLGHAAQEVRLIGLLRDGRLQQAVRSDHGPLPGLPPALPVPAPKALRSLDVAAGVSRIVMLDGEHPAFRSGAPLWRALLDGALCSDPPWLGWLERLRRLPAPLRAGVLRLLPDGAYALVIAGAGEEMPGIKLVMVLHSGRIVRVGGAALGRGAELRTASPKADPPGLEPVRLVLRGRLEVLTRLLASSRPVSFLEHARQRAELEALRVSPRLAVALPLLRLAGF